MLSGQFWEQLASVIAVKGDHIEHCVPKNNNKPTAVKNLRPLNASALEFITNLGDDKKAQYSSGFF